ncbi:MAG TPA: hypothetical protein VL171_07740 [Verrucomicrobiae bacterium]|nr:hypothetical protein [Verrucomicrobiae bacterium]
MTVSNYGFLIIAGTCALGVFWIFSEIAEKSKSAIRLTLGITFSVLLAMSVTVLRDFTAAAKMYHVESFLFALSDCATDKQDNLALKYLRRYKMAVQRLENGDIVRVVVTLHRELQAERKPSEFSTSQP